MGNIDHDHLDTATIKKIYLCKARSSRVKSAIIQVIKDKQLLTTIKNIIVVMVIGFVSANILSILGFANLLVVAFSMGLMLMSADGFLTKFALKNGAIEVNPLMDYLNKKIGDNKGILLSRITGLLILSIGLLANNAYFCLAIAWLFCMVVLLNSANLASRSSNCIVNSDVENSEPCNDA
jgi:hypothetical protein